MRAEAGHGGQEGEAIFSPMTMRLRASNAHCATMATLDKIEGSSLIARPPTGSLTVIQQGAAANRSSAFV
jgi:hypothetical protein